MRALTFIAISAALHVLIGFMVYWFVPPGLPRELFRPLRMPAFLPLPASRLRPSPPQPLSPVLLDRLRADVPDLSAMVRALPDTASMVTPVEPAPVSHLGEPGAREPWMPVRDSLATPDLYRDQVTALASVDPLEFDALGHRRTVAITDPSSGKLVRAFLHLPARIYPTGCGRPLAEALAWIGRGLKVEEHVPIQSQIHWTWHGTLSPQEMDEYPVLHLSYIGVPSSQALAGYLLRGGFVLCSRYYLDSVVACLHEAGRASAALVSLELEHPVYHSFFELTRYVEPNPVCQFGIQRLAAVELDGRVVAIDSGSFNTQVSCPGNRLYVNILAFALAQPSRMGGRFASGEGKQ